MARSPRGDGPGVWHHVTNRGIARRTVFENARDVRFFLSRLAHVVRAGWVEVHAYCLMTTHFHLLVRSNESGLSRAMERLLNDYVRWFNRGRGRDGALFRGRFRSRPVDSYEYRRRVVAYIDANPVLANLVPAPALYPHGSAWHYARECGPIWLERSWIETEVRETSGAAAYAPRDYAACFGVHVGPALAHLIERRVEWPARARDPLDDLLGAAPEVVLAWMRRKAALADGTSIDLPLCDARDVIELVAQHRAQREDWHLQLSRVRSSGWRSVEVGLLRDLCGSSWSEIAAQITTAEHGARRAYGIHRKALQAIGEYARTIEQLVRLALDRCYGSRATVGRTEPASEPPGLSSWTSQARSPAAT